MADTLNQPAPEPVATVAPPAAEPVSVQPLDTSTGASADLLERAGKFDIDTSGFKSDKDLAAHLFDLYEKDRPYSQYGRQALSTPFGSKQEPPKPAEQPESAEPAAFDLDKHFSEAWKIPELSPGAQWALQHGAIIENEKGMLVAAPGLEQAGLPYLREVQEHQQARAALSEEFNKNPVRYVYDKMIDALRHELRGDFEQLDREKTTKTQAEAFEQKFATENQWLFEGNGQLSPAGLKFRQTVEQWRAKGVNDPEALAQLGIAAAKPADSQAAPTQEPPNGNGQPRGPDGKFSKQASFLENAKRQSAASGSRNAPSAEDFKPANRGELDNIWMDAFQKSRAGAA